MGAKGVIQPPTPTVIKYTLLLMLQPVPVGIPQTHANLQSQGRKVTSSVISFQYYQLFSISAVY